MRVISGLAKGHPLIPVKGRATRPTTDKVKEALFNLIGPYFAEKTVVLDLFAGTGALGIEALSRGAGKAVFVDMSYDSVATVKQNLAATHFVAKAEVYRNDAFRALKVLMKTKSVFDLIFLDPPYAKKNGQRVIEAIGHLGLCQNGGLIILEHHSTVIYADQIVHFKKTKCANYGDISLSIYEKTEA